MPREGDRESERGLGQRPGEPSEGRLRSHFLNPLSPTYASPLHELGREKAHKHNWKNHENKILQSQNERAAVTEE